MTFSIGENVGAYRIVDQLGQGGMATVFKAYHPGLDRYVAIKVLHPALMEGGSFVQRFNREARIVARLEHPSIVPVYDYAEHKGMAYLVMRFIEGETLKARLKRGPLSIDQIHQVVKQVGSALSYAHQQGILHRDIKPSNILLTGDPNDPNELGELFLADFGLARIAEMGESTLSRDMMMGTPQYISPEQARGDLDLDAGTDIYSFGVVVYELLTGRVPFSADTPYSIIHDHIFAPLPLPTSINPDIPQEVERVLLKALAKERNDRYQDIDAFVNAFSRALSSSSAQKAEEATFYEPLLPPTPAQVKDEKVESGPPTAAEFKKTKRAKKISPWMIAGGILIILVLCLSSALVVRRVILKNRDNGALVDQMVDFPRIPTPEDPVLAAQIATQDQLVIEHPDDARAWMDLAFMYTAAGAIDEAHELMRRAVDLQPVDENIYMEIGGYLTQNGEHGFAAEVYLTGLRVLPDSKQIRTNLGIVLWQLGAPAYDPTRAEELSRQLVDLAPENPFAHCLLARSLISQGKLDEARGEIDFVIKNAPRLGEGHLVNAMWLRKNGQIVAARREMRLALESEFMEEWLRPEIEKELPDLGD